MDYWPGYVVLDRRGGRAPETDEFQRSLEAIRRNDWPSAAQGLEKLLAKQPRQPLLSLLWAWCAENDERAGTQPQMLERLRDVVRSDAAGLVRFVVWGHFDRLSPEETFELMNLAPQGPRTPEERVWLAQAALNAGVPKSALTTVRDVNDASDDAVDFSLRKIEVEALLQIHRLQEAATIAGDWVEKHRSSSVRIGDLGVLLLRYGLKAPGVQLMKQALSDPKLTAEVRLALAGQWASELLREARASADPRRAGDFCLQVLEMGQMPESLLPWACERLNSAGRHQRVIELAEQRLRKGRVLPREFLEQLQRAYLGANRPDDAERAATSIPLYSLGGSGR
jgi:hypothetical protein